MVKWELRLFARAGAPKDVGLFLSRGPLNDIYYFSPGAVDIAGELIDQYHGIICDAPARADVEELFSRGGAAEIPFADSF